MKVTLTVKLDVPVSCLAGCPCPNCVQKTLDKVSTDLCPVLKHGLQWLLDDKDPFVLFPERILVVSVEVENPSESLQISPDLVQEMREFVKTLWPSIEQRQKLLDKLAVVQSKTPPPF